MIKCVLSTLFSPFSNFSASRDMLLSQVGGGDNSDNSAASRSVVSVVALTPPLARLLRPARAAVKQKAQRNSVGYSPPEPPRAQGTEFKVRRQKQAVKHTLFQVGFAHAPKVRPKLFALLRRSGASCALCGSRRRKIDIIRSRLPADCSRLRRRIMKNFTQFRAGYGGYSPPHPLARGATPGRGWICRLTMRKPSVLLNSTPMWAGRHNTEGRPSRRIKNNATM